MSEILNDHLGQIVATIVTLFGAIITYVLIPALRAWQVKQTAESTDVLTESVKDYIYQTAEFLADNELPKIARDMERYGHDQQYVKTRLHQLGQSVIKDTVEYWKRQGIDLIKTVGHDLLNKWVAAAADKVNPWQGQSTSEQMVSDVASRKTLVTLGTAAVRQQHVPF